MSTTTPTSNKKARGAGYGPPVDNVTHLCHQFETEANCETTGPKIVHDMQAIDTQMTHSGTGTYHGAGKYIKEQPPDTKVIMVEPERAALHFDSKGMPGDLPSSPAARAFFAALDGGAKSDPKWASSSSSSSFVQKRIQTLGWRNRFSQEEFYPVTIQDNIEITVRQVQRGEVDGTYGTGATVWPAAVVLIKYLEKHAERLLKNKRCVDLGSGTGVTSIAAALLGAREVVCTDGEPNVVQLAQDNLDRALGELEEQGIPIENETTRMIRNCPLYVEKYWWGSGTISGGNHADVVLVADCVLPKLYPIGPLVDAIDVILKTKDAVAILSYEYRYFPEFDPGTEFRRLCSMKGLLVESIPLSEQDPVYSVEDIEIWHVYRS